MATEGKTADYLVSCQACDFTMCGEIHQVAEDLAEQVQVGQVACPRCGTVAWAFREQLTDQD